MEVTYRRPPWLSGSYHPRWVYGPLVAAVFSSETSDEPAPMLFSNICPRPPGAVKRP